MELSLATPCSVMTYLFPFGAAGFSKNQLSTGVPSGNFSPFVIPLPETGNIIQRISEMTVNEFFIAIFNVSSTNYFTQYKRLRRTDITISSKSPFLLRITPPKLGDSVTQLRLSSKDWPCLNPLCSLSDVHWTSS